MADDTVLEVLKVAVKFVETDAAYGPNHERTREAKAQLVQAVAEVMADDVDIPQLHVIPGALDDGGT